jgi:hypothetical protein
MKKLYFIILILLSLSIFSCSSDDSEMTEIEAENPQDDEPSNGLKINGMVYELSYTYVNDENTTDSDASDIAIIMSNVDVLSEDQVNNVTFLYFDFQGVDLEVGEITSISDYRISTNANSNNSEISGGTTVLDDTEFGFQVIETSIKIIALDSNQIDIEFSFTREDGEVISGNYSGNYTDLSQE